MNKIVLIKNLFARMQKETVETLCILCALLFIAADCDSNSREEVNPKDIGLKDVVLFSCEKSTNSTSTDFDKYIKFLDNGKNTLKIEYRFLMNCCCEDIGVEINPEKNSITINIHDEDCGCNCICPRIVCFEIVNLKEKNNYEFIFLRNTQVFYTCELLFIKKVNYIIQLQ